jgi:hypothetical protein
MAVIEGLNLRNVEIKIFFLNEIQLIGDFYLIGGETISRSVLGARTGVRQFTLPEACRLIPGKHGIDIEFGDLCVGISQDIIADIHVTGHLRLSMDYLDQKSA